MDEVDLQILHLLAHNGRMTWAELAQRVRLSPPATAERAKRLEERGIIRGYAALIDREALGAGLTAFVDVDLVDSGRRPAFLALVASLPSVLECHHVTGDHDYRLKVACSGPRDLDRLINEVLKGDALVARTRTAIVLASPKETAFQPPTDPA
ncbi:MAG: Lrp/AsnC family transcriptional regulator [Rubrivivax sp.]|nr:Lrp/AsnC family transcriptional regulator [Rubrivivax sp.]